MRAKAGIFIVLGLFVVIGTVSALMADSASTITTSKAWPVANGYDSSIITVVAKNTSSGSFVPYATVTFTVSDPVYGSMSTAAVTADALGVATSTFLTKTKSGTAIITASITSNDAGTPHTMITTLNQKIDHDVAQSAVFDHPAKLQVGAISDLTITLTDRYGNLIDNKNPSEHHTFSIHMPAAGDGWGLWDGSDYISEKPVETDMYGNTSTRFRIATTAISNWIYMDAIGNIVIPPETWIEGISESNPWYVSQTYPSPSALAADGLHQFEFYYTVNDQYMNPVNNTEIRITASDGTSINKMTNALGKVWVSFGPKDFIGTYTITATPLANTSALCVDTGAIGNCSQEVEFFNTDPVDLMVMANPQAMASRDVDSTSSGTVLARVVDIRGNPVFGETVRFSLDTPVYPGGPYNVTSPPGLSAASATVDSGGYATVKFTPGAFTPYGPIDYNWTATGTVNVIATWTNSSGVDINRQVTFVWKNYPFLSITVPPEVCQQVYVGDKINVTIRITGDGAGLRPKPIDAILVMDVSGSMAEDMNGPDGLKTKLYYSKLSGNTFVSKMNTATDQIGLVTYDTNADVRQSLTTDFATVKTKLSHMTAKENTSQRMGTYLGIKEMVEHRNPNSYSVQAIIVMTDGQYNQNGDPLARGKGARIHTEEGHWGDGVLDWYVIPGLGGKTDDRQNLSEYARQNTIRIYTVTFGTDSAIAPGTALYKTLDTIAITTGGKHYHANDGSQLTDVYSTIADELKDTAGGDTVVSLDFGTAKINDIPGGGDIRHFMEYVADVHTPDARSSDSTYLNKTNITASGTMKYLDGFPYSQDDTVNWGARAMSYTVGEMKLNDTWSATFRLNMSKAGKVELFGPSDPSKTSFTDASTGVTTNQFIPSLQCNIQESLKDKGFSQRNLSIDNLSANVIGPYPDLLTIKWNTTYDGEKIVEETVSYRNTADPSSRYMVVPGGVLYQSKCKEKTTVLITDTATWTPGVYSIRVVATAVDAENPEVISTTWEKPESAELKYIKLE